ncbi:MAG TPA: coproporphyrinogen-III oxidase family protein [Spirochaetales bacterium]|nr:coproporphyrinogen-III oxidase family protein [Spirochaetales bacterium]
MIDIPLAAVAAVAEKPKSLYIHIPFCVSKCAYCDFYSLPKSSFSEAWQLDYVNQVLKRIDRFCDLFRLDSLETLYLGGGTPTCLEDHVFERLVGQLDMRFGTDLKEWTIEANPESLTLPKLEIISHYRVTRVSLGIQSMADEELELMGRAGRSEHNRRALSELRPLIDQGLSVSADLILAYPTKIPAGPIQQSRSQERLSRLEGVIQYLVDSGVNHISLYDLTLEDNTPLKSAVEGGRLVLGDEDQLYGVRKTSEWFLEVLGFERYEVSNFARHGAKSLHNSTYWAMKSYLGVGSGAVSTLIIRPDADDFHRSDVYSVRIEEDKILDRYIYNTDVPVSSYLGKKDSLFEMVMMGLRTVQGVDESRFEKHFGVSFCRTFHRSIDKWAGHFVECGASIHLDDQGLDILNSILVDMLVDLDAFVG